MPLAITRRQQDNLLWFGACFVINDTSWDVECLLLIGEYEFRLLWSLWSLLIGLFLLGGIFLLRLLVLVLFIFDGRVVDDGYWWLVFGGNLVEGTFKGVVTRVWRWSVGRLKEGGECNEEEDHYGGENAGIY